MKVVVQNFKTGVLSLEEVPSPKTPRNGVLVRTRSSLISVGTERAAIQLAKRSYLGKAKDRPDLARQVINKAKTDGFLATYKVVQNLIAEPIPLGYSLVGDVVGVGKDCHDVKVGDRVACAGLGYANHGELVAIPKNLFVPVPKTIDDEQAAYVTLGAIAMHGVRQADQQFGANVLVVGLGLVGQITVQLCQAAGHRVFGMDLDTGKFEMAHTGGARQCFHPNEDNLKNLVEAATNGYGFDAVLLTAASKDDGAIFNQVADLCRDRAKVVVVGECKMDMMRRLFFNKEIDIVQSRSYGPGRYDQNYEEKGQDYPIGYVRWTERRNMEAFINLLADKRIDMSSLTTHRFDINDAEKAYEIVTGKRKEFAIGILLNYPETETSKPLGMPSIAGKKAVSNGKIGLGVIGTGKFAKGILLPAMMGTDGFSVVGVASAGGLSANSVQQKYDAKFATSDGMELINNDEIDAVIIATRPDSHAAFVIEALKRDKHVFVEKPLCLNKDELLKIQQVAEQSKGILTVGYNRRYSPVMQNLAEHFAGRSEPLSMMYRVNPGRIPLSEKEGWVHEADVGGGRIISEVCHFIDTMQYVCGSRPVKVSSQGMVINKNQLVSNDIVTISISFEDGSIGTIHYWANGDKSYPKERMEVFGDERIAVMDNYLRLELVKNGSKKTKRLISQQKGFDQEAKAFLQGCRSGEYPIKLESLIDTALVSFLATEDLLGDDLPELANS